MRRTEIVEVTEAVEAIWTLRCVPAIEQERSPPGQRVVIVELAAVYQLP